MGIHGKDLKEKQDGMSHEITGQERREMCLAAECRTRLLHPRTAICVKAAIMSVILTVSRLNYSILDWYFIFFPEASLIRLCNVGLVLQKVIFIHFCHHFFITSFCVCMCTKTQIAMWLDLGWLASVRSSESIVLHMALTVRVLSPQAQLKALNSCYVLFPWHQANTNLFSLYFKMMYC